MGLDQLTFRRMEPGYFVMITTPELSIYGYDVINGEKLFESSDSFPQPSSLVGNDSQMVIGCHNVARIFNTVVSLKVKELEQVAKYDSAAVSNEGQIVAFCEEKREISIYDS